MDLKFECTLDSQTVSKSGEVKIALRISQLYLADAIKSVTLIDKKVKLGIVSEETATKILVPNVFFKSLGVDKEGESKVIFITMIDDCAHALPSIKDFVQKSIIAIIKAK